MAGNSVCLLAFLVAMAATVNAVPTPYYALTRTNNGSHHLIAGTHVEGDRLVLSQPVYKAASGSQVVSVQGVYSAGPWETITVVKALDESTTDIGAYPTIVKGGPGTNNVTIRFESMRGQSINFVVELYAR